LKISNWKLLNKNSLVAAFDLALPSGICVYGAMLMRSGGSEWISFPGIPIGEKDGKKTYKPVVAIPDRDTRDKFNAQVISALQSAGHI
jgi:UDP:flavonoid glycosyltransferase YjiC (YdhE family)